MLIADGKEVAHFPNIATFAQKAATSQKIIKAMSHKDFKYYLDNQSKLPDSYNGRYIVITGSNVVEDYQRLPRHSLSR